MKRPFFGNEKTTAIDDQIEAVIIEMKLLGVDSEEYPKLMTLLERLHELKVKERPDPVSRDTMAVIAGNLTGILLIVSYEHVHVMTSKALSLLTRPKGTN